LRVLPPPSSLLSSLRSTGGHQGRRRGDPPETEGPVGIPTAVGLARVYVSFAERGRESLFPLHLPRGGMCSIGRFVTLYNIAQYSAVQRIGL